MASRSERLIVDTHAAPTAGSGQTFPVEPWQGDLPTVVIVVSETPYASDIIAIVPTNVEWLALSATEEIQTLHEVTAIPTSMDNVPRSSLVLIIFGSIVGFVVVFVAITLCSIRLARKHSRRAKRRTYEEAALEEVLRSGTVTLRGQEVGLERLQKASKRKWGNEEFAMRVLEKDESEQRRLREKAQDERTLLKSMFERNCEEVDWDHDGRA
ncbi:hypothetical protein T440DRAFT_504116 [Plenodomus tracheiphilus IPT5]|uniref:Uncharacterized protein n=1 Tax=Plenodomus tracheiphilus IPT5 TaxID=1408161 RepID=A0A6A7BLZ8_9PLEO|nr:hypothetical protein T440DRAFT_504116 [Plenodomus tracheiphilus IPT5]